MNLDLDARTPPKWEGTNQDPLADTGVCDNPGQEDQWNCPGCFNEIAGNWEDTVTCKCGAVVELQNVTQPVSRAVMKRRRA